MGGEQKAQGFRLCALLNKNLKSVGVVLLVGSTTSLKFSKKMEDCEHQQRHDLR